jgi:hypothetical protein
VLVGMRKKKKGAAARVWGIFKLGNKRSGKGFLTYKEIGSSVFGSLGMGLF